MLILNCMPSYFNTLTKVRFFGEPWVVLVRMEGKKHIGSFFYAVFIFFHLFQNLVSGF